MSAVAGAAGAHLGWNVADDVRQMFAYHFMVNAFWAGTIVAVVAGAIGWLMVLRRQTFAGHTLAVVGFPGASGAAWLGIGLGWGYFGFCVAAAAVLAAVPRPETSEGFSEESAVVGTVQAFALACGFLFTSLSGSFLNGISALLFGTFLGITDGQVVVLALVAGFTLLVAAVIGRRLFFASVDADVARARRLPVRALSAVFLLLLGLATAEVSQITGSLLVFAILVMPAAAAQRLTARPSVSVALTVALALAVTWLGLAAAYFSVYPVGFFVTTLAFVAYVAAVAISSGRERLGRRPARAMAAPA
ncbi:MAG: metal ABC transporter permease [Acidimicrobiales bacterium]